MLDTVELRQIRVFLVLAEELHFGRTGARLSISPSYVSQTVRALEASLGGKLFERTSRSVRLTLVGEQLQSDLIPLLGSLQGALIDAREAATGLAGRLRIGSYSPHTFGPRWVQIVSLFGALNPDCELTFIDTGFQRDYLDWLRSGEADILVVRLPLSVRDITVGPVLSREQRVVAVAANDPLARCESVSYEELADRTVSDFPAMPREMMDAFIPPTTPSGRTLTRITNRSIEEAMMRVVVGAEVHPTVVSLLDQHKRPGIVAIPIRDLPPSETAIAWLAANRSPKIAAFAGAAARVLGDDCAAEHAAEGGERPSGGGG
jgi:DNA-binding transcriptional LysR family regulator